MACLTANLLVRGPHPASAVQMVTDPAYAGSLGEFSTELMAEIARADSLSRVNWASDVRTAMLMAVRPACPCRTFLCG